MAPPTAVRGTALIVGLTLLLAACDGGSTETTAVPEPTTTVSTTAPQAPQGPVGRLVVIDGDGNLATMTPEGGDVVKLTDGAAERLQFLQPTWSPDGRRVAWTEVDGRQGSPGSSLVTSTGDAGDPTRATVPFPPFYLYWDPTSARLAYLGSGPDGLEVGILEVADGGDTATEIDTGQPYYFAWAPEGREMLIHVGADRLQRMNLSGGATDLGPTPGRFPSPGWSDDGAVIAYAASEGDRQYLAVADPDGLNEQRIAEFDGFVSFVLSPDGSRIAYQALGAPGDQGVTAAGPGVLAAAPTAQGGGGALSIADIATGEVTTLTLTPELAFFWSPDGRRLLSLGLDPADPTPVVRWTVWDGTDSSTGPPFTPSPTFFRDYLPFFDQYAHSMSLWSPDGSAFAYPGTDESGGAGIWVQQADFSSNPALVSDGSFVAWSPG